jgi:hypothetical protein
MLDPLGANWGARIGELTSSQSSKGILSAVFLTRILFSTGYLFGGLTFVWLIIMYFYMPETKGRTPAEIDEMFEAGIPARKFSSTRTKVDMAADELREASA